MMTAAIAAMVGRRAGWVLFFITAYQQTAAEKVYGRLRIPGPAVCACRRTDNIHLFKDFYERPWQWEEAPAKHPAEAKNIASPDPPPFDTRSLRPYIPSNTVAFRAMMRICAPRQRNGSGRFHRR
jgi:hypothetical protein